MYVRQIKTRTCLTLPSALMKLQCLISVTLNDGLLRVVNLCKSVISIKFAYCI